MRLICTLCIGVSKNPFRLLHLWYYKMVQSLYKTDFWFQKSHDVFGQLQTSSGKSKKLKFYGLLLSKKYIPSAKTFYLEDLSNITVNYLRENSENSLCYLWNHKSFFTTQLVCNFLAQSLHTSAKVAHQSSHFQTFHCSR